MTHIPSSDDATASSSAADAFIRKLEARQNLPLAIVAGAVACLASAALWAAITVATKYQIGYIAIAVGFIVGFAVRIAGQGFSKPFGVVGAIFALIGCVVGNFLSMVGFLCVEEQLNFFEVLMDINYSMVPSLMVDTFQPMDLLFYGLAAYAGYRCSFRRLNEAEINAMSAG